MDATRVARGLRCAHSPRGDVVARATVAGLRRSRTHGGGTRAHRNVMMRAVSEGNLGASDEETRIFAGDEGRSIEELQAEMAGLEEQIHEAHLQAHVQEQRIAERLSNLRDVGEVSKALESSLASVGASPRAAPEAAGSSGTGTSSASTTTTTASSSSSPSATKKEERANHGLRSDLTWPKKLIDYWYPLEFSKNVAESGGASIDFEVFDLDLSLRRCASTGAAEIVGKGQREEEEERRAYPTVEKDGMIWCWLSDKEAPEEIPGFTVPPDAFREESPFTIHAELVIDVAVEHGLLLENLLDLAHAPFTHTQTFAKGWSIPDLVKFNTSKLLGGNWEPYPIDMSFEPPCMVLSTIGLMQPGKLEEGARAAACQNHLHQLHVCLPSAKGTRLLYRMSLDFMDFMKFVPFAKSIWSEMAAQVLGEDLRLVQGQEDRLRRGGDTWRNPVPYDKLAVRYRRWRNSLDGDEKKRREAEMNLRTMSAGEMLAPVNEEEEE